MNAQSNQLEFAFKRNGIPYRVIGGTRFFDRAEVKDVLAYLCVLANPSDEIRLARIVNQPPRGIGQTTLETVRRLAEEKGVSSYVIMGQAGEYPDLSRGSVKLRTFTAMIDELRALETEMTLPELYEEVLRRTGYTAMLEAKLTDENQTRLENVNELKTNILSYMKENPEGGLKGFLDEISLYTDIDSLDRTQDCVAMMTMHAAKGLEFDTVFIVGAEEGVFPGSRSIGEPEEMEEERRLCYVAMTRARKNLYFVCARHRMLFGRTVSGRPSRFVDEIPKEHILRPSENGFSFGGETDLWDTKPSGPSTGYGTGYGYGARRTYSGSRGSGQPAHREAFSPEKKKKESFTAPKAAESFAAGDRVRHKAFGEGIVVSVQPTGSDALMEISFENVGTKRLMRNTASAFMKKI